MLARVLGGEPQAECSRAEVFFRTMVGNTIDDIDLEWDDYEREKNLQNMRKSVGPWNRNPYAYDEHQEGVDHGAPRSSARTVGDIQRK